ncbi:MAG: hypothetical protein H0W09_06725 [Solirubrobacterales bacterium]|nr:hypothetical protein [Solirubrobacterales bacterium]
MHGERVQVGRVVDEAFKLYGQYAGPLLGSAAVVLGLVGLLNGLLATTGSLVWLFVGTVLSLIATTLYSGFVVKLVEDVRDGRRDFTVGDLFRAASAFVGALIINSILWGLGVGLGLLLLIVPGLFLLTIWAVTAPAIVIENRGPIEAFRRSAELVKGDGLAVFGTMLVAFLVTLGIGFIIGGLGLALGDGGRIVLSAIGNIIAAPIFALVTAIVFFDLRGDPAGAAGEPEAPGEGRESVPS